MCSELPEPDLGPPLVDLGSNWLLSVPILYLLLNERHSHLKVSDM